MSNVKQRLAEISLHDCQGRRKYVTARERQRFRQKAEQLPATERAFCLLFYLTGLRISEALALKVTNFDFEERVVVIHTLKRRRTGIYRAIPLPPCFLKIMAEITASLPDDSAVWQFSRKTGYRLIKALMAKSKITGLPASPKGLRHGFGIACAQQNVPLPTIAKWMGHSSITTTAIYLQAVGQEEREFAKRIW